MYACLAGPESAAMVPWFRWVWQGPTPDDGDDVDIKILPDKLAEEEGPVPSRLRILEFDKKAGELDTQPKRKGGKGRVASVISIDGVRVFD